MFRNWNRKRPRSIAVTIALFFSILSGVVLLILGGVQMYVNFLSIRDEVWSNQILIASNAAKTVSGFVQDQFENLKSATRFGDLSAASLEDKQIILNKLIGGESPFRQLKIIDSDGRVVAEVSQRSSFRSDLTSNFNKDAVFARLHKESTYISEVFVDKETNEPEVILAVPVTDVFGDFNSILLAELNLKFMWNLVDSITVGQKGHAYVVDRRGDLIAFGDNSRVLKGENVSNLDVVQDFLSNRSSTSQVRSFSKGILGTYVVDTGVSLGVPDWAVMVELPVLEAYSREIRSLYISLIIIAILIILVSLFTVYLSKLITKPINLLSSTAIAVSNGDLSRRAEIISKDEIGKLAETFNYMIDSVEFDKNKLKEAKAKDEAILLSMGDGLIATDKNGNIILVNKSFEEMLGWKEDEVLNKPFFEVITKIDEMGQPVPLESRTFSRVLSGEKINQVHTGYYVRKNGTTFPVASTVRPIQIGKETIGAVEVIRDITKEKELDRAKSEFISIASHQLRTPLTAIYWLVESLEYAFASANLTQKQRSYIDDLNSATQRAIKLVEDLLNVSRIESRAFTIHTEFINPSEFIKDFINDMEIYTKSRNHSITFEDKANNPAKLNIDPKIFYISLQNLVSNAVYNSPADTKVKITLEDFSDSIKISVTNEGVGIPDEEKGRIFQKFYRGENSRKTKTEGSGLGLFIVKSFIESIGGTVGFESELNKETTFWFTIPIK